MPENKPREEGPRTMLTFAQPAQPLVDDQLVPSMTPEGLRKLARTDPEWPIAADEYGHVAGARLLPYERVVVYFQTRSKRTGRGPARKTDDDRQEGTPDGE